MARTRQQRTSAVTSAANGKADSILSLRFSGRPWTKQS